MLPSLVQETSPSYVDSSLSLTLLTLCLPRPLWFPVYTTHKTIVPGELLAYWDRPLSSKVWSHLQALTWAAWVRLAIGEGWTLC